MLFKRRGLARTGGGRSRGCRRWEIKLKGSASIADSLELWRRKALELVERLMLGDIRIQDIAVDVLEMFTQTLEAYR